MLNTKCNIICIALLQLLAFLVCVLTTDLNAEPLAGKRGHTIIQKHTPKIMEAYIFLCHGCILCFRERATVALAAHGFLTEETHHSAKAHRGQ